ncbi:hypothetical protein [Bryobacter aggregatus]|uniref:hypothetical protein n=1 Tax=Bryobacter aggregatus TaxID=360054 RepID=UPI0004E1B2BE|nr:hypothetical protein [Bryobacter aggregatus]
MIPIQLTENDYINPEAVCRLHCQPKTDDRRAAITIVFTDEDQLPLYLHGEEAEEAIANWRSFHQRQVHAASFPATD